MPFVNSETSLDLTWSKKCVISSVIGITEAKLYAHTVALSAKDNVTIIETIRIWFSKNN